MSDVEVSDNFLSLVDFEVLKKRLEDSSTWGYLPDTAGVYDQTTEDHVNNCQMTTVIYSFSRPQNALFDFIEPVLTKAEAFLLIKAKANITFASPDNRVFGWHKDFHTAPRDTRTAVLFFDDTDGATLVETPEGVIEVECKANRFVSFPVNYSHTGVTHTNNKRRMLLNLNYVRVEENGSHTARN